jgi:hypothetical protein
MKMLKMKTKHIKLFEQFTTSGSGSGMDPVIIAKGDWSRILLDPTNENISMYASFVQPSTFTVDYLTNPKAGEAPDVTYVTYDDVETIVDDIVAGDQNGHVLAPKDYVRPSHSKGSQADMDEKNGIVRLSVDPSIDPEEIRSALEVALNTINEDGWDQEGDMAEDIVSDSRASSIYTPEYIRHCQMLVDGKPTSMNRELIFNIK